MSKRYVFWRTPEGKPYRGTDGKFAPREALAEFGRTARVNQGQVSWTGFDVVRLDLAIKLSAAVISPSGEALGEIDAWSIVRPALTEAVKKKGGSHPLEAKEVAQIADRIAGEYFRKPEASYELVSSLSVQSLPFKRARVAGCTIRPLASRRDYAYPDHIDSRGGPVIAKHIQSSRYQPVGVKTRGRSPCAAADRAFRALSLLRGLWSLHATYGSWSMGFGGPRRPPIGVIHTGPIHTLHHPDKALVGDYYWYERAASEDLKLFAPSKGWHKIERFRKWAINRIRILPFGKDIEALIIRYIIALDQSDHDVAFLQMWSILERLTNTVGANYDETVRRAVWPFSDRDLAKNLLDCARLQRNLYVHAAKSAEEPDQVSYLMKSFVDHHLINLIRNDFAVMSLEEYGQYLSLPTDVTTLARNRKWATRAIRFLTSKAPTE